MADTRALWLDRRSNQRAEEASSACVQPWTQADKPVSKTLSVRYVGGPWSIYEVFCVILALWPIQEAPCQILEALADT